MPQSYIIAIKLKLFLFLFSFSIFTSTAQDWEWAVRGGSIHDFQEHEEVAELKVDEAGNVYGVSKVGYAGLDIDDIPKTAYGYGLLLYSYDCEGNYRWSKSVSGYHYMFSRPNVGLDTLGHVFVTGKIKASASPWGNEEPVHFDTDSVLPHSNNDNEYKKDMFLLRYSTDGDLENLVMPQPDTIHRLETFKDVSKDMFVEPNGTVHWWMKIEGGHMISGQEITETGHYIFRYDVNGTYLSHIQMEVENLLHVNMAYSPQSQSYYVSGTDAYYNDDEIDLKFGGETVTSSAFVAKFNNNGNLEWFQTNTSQTFDEVKFYGRPILDEQEHIYITGNTSGNDDFLGFSPENSLGTAVFPIIIKLDSEGNFVAGNHADTDNGSQSPRATISGDLFAITGEMAGITWGGEYYPSIPNSGYDTYIATFDKETLSFNSMDYIVSNNGASENGTAIVGDRRGNFYVGGSMTGQIIVNEETLINDGSDTDFFLVKYGTENCDCELPEASFTYTQDTTGEVSFSFTGSTDYNSIDWEFGDSNSTTDTNPTHSYTLGSEYWACVTVYNDCGYDSFCTSIDASTLGVDALDPSQFRFYPNPVQDILNIKVTEPLQYIVYSLEGRLIQEGRLQENTNTLNLSQLPVGVYMLKLQNSLGQQHTLKLVKH